MIIVHMHFEHGIRRANTATFDVKLHGVLCIADLIGIFARQHLFAAFKDANVLSSTRETRCGDTCAIA